MAFKNSKTKKSTAKKFRCVVKPAAEEKPPVEEALALTEVKQSASNKITVTFNKDVSKEVTAENLSIVSDDAAARQIAVKSVAFSPDGKSAEVLIFGNFVDGTSYKVTYTTLEGTFPASVGAVASVVINTTEAQQNVTTPIDFQLFDANGIDVTPSIALDSYTSVSVSGNYATAEVNRPSAAKITLSTIGMVATVTVTYNANTATSQNISATQDIVCVDPKAVSGNTRFVVLDQNQSANSARINANSECAKFYQNLSDSSAKIAVGNESKYVYFCATDEKGEPISYDSYKVESSNDNIVVADVEEATGNKGGTFGKYALIKATGTNVGSAQLIVTASKNGKDSSYIIPVTTYKAGVATKMTVDVSRTSMSDSADPDYYSRITAKLYDAADNQINGTFRGEGTSTINATRAAITGSGIVSNVKEGTFDVYAADANAGSYTFEISGSDNVDNSKAITRRVDIRVSKLPAVLKDVSYQIEVSDAKGTSNASSMTLDIADKDKQDAFVKLYATCGNLFAGYVRDGELDTGTILGKPISTTGQAIKSVSAGAIFGTIFVGTNSSHIGELNTTGSALAADTDLHLTSDGYSNPTSLGAIIGWKVKSVVPQGNTVDAKPDGEGDIARLGGYTIRYELTMRDDKLAYPKTAGITVTNSYVMPTVSVLSTKVNDITNIIGEGSLSTNVDMNNNTSNYESIKNLCDANYNPASTTSNNTKLTMRYAQVEDNVIVGQTWKLYVPANATFVQN